MLTKDHVYSDIVNETGASTATISRVNRSLSYDGSGGYNIVFDRLDKKEDKNCFDTADFRYYDKLIENVDFGKSTRSVATYKTIQFRA